MTDKNYKGGNDLGSTEEFLNKEKAESIDETVEQPTVFTLDEEEIEKQDKIYSEGTTIAERITKTFLYCATAVTMMSLYFCNDGQIANNNSNYNPLLDTLNQKIDAMDIGDKTINNNYYPEEKTPVDSSKYKDLNLDHTKELDAEFDRSFDELFGGDYK